MVRDSSDSFSGPSRLRAFTSAIGLTSPVSKGSSTAGSVNTDPPVTRNERAVTTSSYPTRGGFTLFLRVHSARKLPAVTQGSYCKLYVGETPITGGFGEGKTLASLTKKAGGRAPPTHRTFHTKVQLAAQKDCPEWNEKFQVNVFNPTSEILTIRVKNQVLVYSPAVGACTVHLGQLRLGETVDNWFPLIKSSKPAGSIRLQLCLQADAAQPELASTMARDSGVSEETIQRLVREHREQQESMRRQMEIRQQEKWKRIEEEELKHVGLKGQMLREKYWHDERNRRATQQEQDNQWGEDHVHGNSDSEVQPDYGTLDIEAEEAVASKLMGEMNMRDSNKGNQRSTEPIVSEAMIDNGVVKEKNARLERRMTDFGTIRLSVEELDQVVQNALPSSDSSDVTSSEEERRRRKHRHREKRSRHRSRKYSKRRFYREESSQSELSSHSSTDDHSETPQTKPSLEKERRKVQMNSPRSGRSNQSHQDQPQRCTDTPLSLTYPLSSSDRSSSDVDRRRQHKSKTSSRRLKPKSLSTRKHKKNRRNYESSASSSSLSSISSSEEERLRRKLRKKKARKAREKTRSRKQSRNSSRDPIDTPDIKYGRNSSDYAGPRDSDSWYAHADQRWTSNDAIGATQPERERRHHLPDKRTDSSVSVNFKLLRSAENDVEGLDSGPIKPITKQYLGQETTERTNTSFCF